MNRLFLALLASPAFLGSALSLTVAIPPAAAQLEAGTEIVCTNTNGYSACVQSRRALGSQGIELTQTEKSDVLDIDKESDAAIARFGCDCPACLNALRQSQGSLMAQ